MPGLRCLRGRPAPLFEERSPARPFCKLLRWPGALPVATCRGKSRRAARLIMPHYQPWLFGMRPAMKSAVRLPKTCPPCARHNRCIMSPCPDTALPPSIATVPLSWPFVPSAPKGSQWCRLRPRAPARQKTGGLTLPAGAAGRIYSLQLRCAAAQRARRMASKACNLI